MPHITESLISNYGNLGFSAQLCLSTKLRKCTITNLDLGEIILLAIFLISNWPRPHNRYENRKQDSLELKIRSNTTKGQLILTRFFGVFNFFQKTNKNKSTRGIVVLKSNWFICFFGRIVGLKKTLQLCLTFNRIENSKTRVITEVTLLTLDGGVSLSMKPPKKG